MLDGRLLSDGNGHVLEIASGTDRSIELVAHLRSRGHIARTRRAAVVTFAERLHLSGRNHWNEDVMKAFPSPEHVLKPYWVRSGRLIGHYRTVIARGDLSSVWDRGCAQPGEDGIRDLKRSKKGALLGLVCLHTAQNVIEHGYGFPNMRSLV